jgi:hypothetical protein
VKPSTYNFPDLVRGDTFDGITSLQITVNDAPPPVALASVRAHFRRSKLAAATLVELSSEDSPATIVIHDSGTWLISIPPGSLDLPVGKAFYDMEFTDTSGRKKTYIAGTIEVLQDVTR